jgi:hypothetical protein
MKAMRSIDAATLASVVGAFLLLLLAPAAHGRAGLPRDVRLN